MDSIATLRLIGLLTATVGTIGYSYSFEGIECDIRILKTMALFYILISIEFIAHNVYIGVEFYHMAIHYILSITALTIGLSTLLTVKGYPRKFVPSRFKEIVVYGVLIWLVDKYLSLKAFSYVAYIALIVSSFLVAVISAYMFYSIKRLRTFFVINGEFLMALNFVILLIGISTLTFCVLPIVIATATVIYTTYRISETAKPFIFR